MDRLPAPAEHVVINGKRMYIDARDARGAAIARAGGVLHPVAGALWRAVMTDDRWDAVVDVGANYGEMLLAAEPPPDARVMAVEPNERVVPYLRRTLAESLPGVHLQQVAVSDLGGEAVFHEDLTWWGNSTLCQEWVADRPHVWTTTTVETVRLDEVLDLLEVTPGMRVAVKLDIEGLEARVLRDGLARLRTLRHAKVMVEAVRLTADEHDWLLDHFHVWYFDVAREALVRVHDETSGAALRRLLGSPGVHPRDVVVAPAVLT
ncbi:FkbM family methyltransferase [Streptomyces sp. NPDC001568]|uniref:FkbM family methyltransferase n=1 Tax=Streptomyces sp. NPDC001568 TaxID=3364588 RepID=UPI0036C4252B